MELCDWAQVALGKCNNDDYPVPLHWLDHVENDSDEDFCYGCAELLCDYFNGKGDRPATIWDGEEIPDWEPAPDSVSIDGDGCVASESDSARFCARCGRRLEFSPTNYCVESELKHYEQHPPKDDWYSFYFLLDSIDEYKQDWYSRALRLAEKYLGSA